MPQPRPQIRLVSRYCAHDDCPEPVFGDEFLCTRHIAEAEALRGKAFADEIFELGVALNRIAAGRKP